MGEVVGKEYQIGSQGRTVYNLGVGIGYIYIRGTKESKITVQETE